MMVIFESYQKRRVVYSVVFKAAWLFLCRVTCDMVVFMLCQLGQEMIVFFQVVLKAVVVLHVVLKALWLEKKSC